MRAILPMVMFLLFAGCENTNFEPGDVYSIDDGSGKIGVIKVLAVDPETIHIKIYDNRFETRPVKIDFNDLQVEANGQTGLGSLHIPVAKEVFKGWEPELLGREKVSEGELGRVTAWKESK